MATFEISGPNGQAYEIQTPGDQEPTPDVIARAKEAMMAEDSSPTPPMFESLDSQLSQQAPEMGAIASSGVEALRGLQGGTGQAISAAGWLAKQATGNKGIQDFGNQMMERAEALPETQLPGVAKFGLNLAGELAPMLATFGAGEALGLVKLGEATVKVLAKTPGMARYLTPLIRPMGQATLFGTVNAIETASTLPETMEFKDKVQAITDSGKVGFIAGAVLTPIMDKGFELIREHGANAGKVYFTNLLGSKEAAEQAMDLSRQQGSYKTLMVDPKAKDGIRFVDQQVGKVSKEEMAMTHDNILRDQELVIRGVRDQHEMLGRDLQDKTTEAGLAFEEGKRRALAEVDASLNLRKANGEFDINTKIGEVASKGAKQLEEIKLGNSQNLIQSAQAFDAKVESTLDLIGKNSGALYESIAKNEPTGGFSADGIISRIRGFLKEYHGVNLTKEQALPAGLDISKLSPEAQQQIMAAGSSRPPVWKAKTRSISGQPPPEAQKVINYLTDENGLLNKIETIAKSNDGKISLDMLREEMRMIDGLAWEGGVRKDRGFSDLYKAIRPNQLVGDITKAVDKGLWRGTDASLVELKNAATLDHSFSSLKDSYKEIKKTYADGVEAKAKGFEKNQAGLAELRAFEDSIGLPKDSPIRLSNSMQAYNRTSQEVLSRSEKLSASLSNAKRFQTNRLNEVLEKAKKEEVERLIGAKATQRSASLAEHRTAVDAKRADLRTAEDLLYQIREGIRQETFSRQLAEQEMSLMAKGDMALGRLQRGTGLGAFFGATRMSPTTPILAGVTLALSPRIAIPVGRAIKRGSESAILRGATKAVERASKSKVSQRLLIHHLLQSSRRQK